MAKKSVKSLKDPYSLSFSKYGVRSRLVNEKGKVKRLSKNLRRLGYKVKMHKLKR